MKEKQDDGLPSKETCIKYTLAVCGCDPKGSDKLIEDMIATRKRDKAICDRIQAESMGVPEAICDKLYPKTWE
jgi:hypothetical protein